MRPSKNASGELVEMCFAPITRSSALLHVRPVTAIDPRSVPFRQMRNRAPSYVAATCVQVLAAIGTVLST